MEKTPSKRRYDRSITPEKSKAKKKATLLVVEKSKNSVSNKYRDRSESPEPKPKKRNKTKHSQKKRRKTTPEREPVTNEVDQIKVSLPINLMEFCDRSLTLMQSVNTVVQSTRQSLEDKLTDIDKRLIDMDRDHYKNWELVSETIEVISKLLISKSNTDSNDENDSESERRESPTTTVKDDILQKAEQFSEQNKAKIAEKKAQKEREERNERVKTMEANSQMMAKNQQTARVSLNLISHGHQLIQNHQKMLQKQQLSQKESQMWHDQQDKRNSELMRQNEQQVRQQIANFYQKQQNARMEYHAAHVEQHIQRQREELTRSQECQQQQQQIINQHEQLISCHNEQLAKHKAQLANEPISIMDRLIVPDYANSTPTIDKEMPEQRVLRPRPTAQVVLQDPFVQPKQKAPRKLTPKPIRERRASVQCDQPPPSYYPNLPMRVPAPVQQPAFTQTNARLIEENFQKKQTQAYAALQNQEIQPQPEKAAKVRERRKSCMPSMSYLDQNLCHEMLRRRLANAQSQNLHDQANNSQPLRYFANTSQSVNNAEKNGQNLSNDPVEWMRGRSASITRIPNTSH